MRNREMTEVVSRLTWDNIRALLAEHAPDGFTNQEIADVLESEYRDTAALTRCMFMAGALSKLTVGKAAGTAFYFLPVTKQ